MYGKTLITTVRVLSLSFVIHEITVGLPPVSIINHQIINSQNNTLYYLFLCYSRSAYVWWTSNGKTLGNFSGTDLFTQQRVEGKITSVYSYTSTLLGSLHENMELLTTLIISDYKNGSNLEVTCSNILDSDTVCAEQINGVSPLNSSDSDVVDVVILEYLSSINLSPILNASINFFLCIIHQSYMNWQVDNGKKVGFGDNDKFADHKILSMDNSLVHAESLFLGSNFGRIVTLLLLKSDDVNTVTCSSGNNKRSLSTNKQNSLKQQSSDVSSFQDYSKMDSYTNTVGEQFLNETFSERSETKDYSGVITVNHLGVIIGFCVVFGIFIPATAGGIIMYHICGKPKNTIRNDSCRADNLDKELSFWSTYNIFSCFIRPRHNCQTPGTA